MTWKRIHSANTFKYEPIRLLIVSVLWNKKSLDCSLEKSTLQLYLFFQIIWKVDIKCIFILFYLYGTVDKNHLILDKNTTWFYINLYLISIMVSQNDVWLMFLTVKYYDGR